MQHRWIRFECVGEVGFGTLDGSEVHERRGDMFGNSEPTGAVLGLAGVKLLTPNGADQGHRTVESATCAFRSSNWSA